MKKKPVFIHIPKTAGNSVRSALAGKLDLIDIGHSTVPRQNLTGRGYFRFCFVRHPFSRLRSAFYHLVDPDHSIGIQTDKFQLQREAMRERYGNDFVAFVGDRGYSKYKIAHLFPQTTWTHFGGRQVVDFMGRLESMDEEWKRLSREIGVDLPPLERRNPTVNRAYAKKDDIPAEAYAAARDFYGADFFYLGYD